MGDRQDDNVKLLVRQSGQDIQAILAPDVIRTCPRIIDRHVDTVVTEIANDITDFGVTHIGTVFLEGKA